MAALISVQCPNCDKIDAALMNECTIQDCPMPMMRGMPMPTPGANETQDDFMSRCIPMVMGDGGASSHDQAIAMCNSMWEDKNAPEVTRRAYSTFKIKSVDAKRRIIEGIASTPSTDRVGDIVEPMGAKFSLPMPFLWQHDSNQPIGHVTEARATKDGITFKAQLVTIKEPGRLKDRTDEAFQSLESGLVRGASIGFKGTDVEPIDAKAPWKGLRFKEWDWFELSAVTIPANIEASITNIRSFDLTIRAASLNSAGAANGRARVAAGDVNDNDPWSFTADDGNKLLGPSGNDWANYSKWFLGLDSSASANTKDRYKYPFGKNGKIYTSALRAIRSRSAQQNDTAVFDAAGKMLDSIESSDQPGQASLSSDQKAKSDPANRGHKAKPSAAAGSRSTKLGGPIMAKQTNGERIKALEAKRAAEVAAREEIHSKVTDEDRTKDEAEQGAFDEHSATIKAIDRELADCRLMEKELITTAKPVAPAVDGNGVDVGDARTVSVRSPTLPPGIAFVKALGCELHAHMFHRDIYSVARQFCGQHPQVENYLRQKAAVAVGTTTSPTWAGPLVYVQNLASEFLEFLVPQTFFGRIPGLTMVPFNSRIPRETSVITAAWVGEGRAKPAQAESFDSVTLTFAKMAAIMGVTQELARFSNPSVEMLVRNNLAKGIAKFLDTQFITPSVTAVAGQNPASITNGADNDSASGTDITAVIHDIREILFHFQEYNIPTDNLVLIMQPVLATSIGTMMTTLGVRQFPDINGQGGSILGVQVITSNNSPAGQITALHPPSIFVADDGGITVDVSTEASVEMADNPTSSDFHLISAFQNNLVFVRAERYITWVRGRDKGAYYLTGAAYGGAVTG
jgi:HK97 family phage major capsid protein/HK97 family phage prohead protease